AHSLEVFEKALELPWVETFMFPYNIVENQGDELMRRLKEKNIAFIDMKPMAGGAIEDGRLALRYICTNDAVSVVIPGMYSVEEVKQNAQAVSDISPLTAEELAAIDKVRGELGTNFCRRCNYCAPCTAGINISGAFLFHGYLSRYGLEDWAKGRYEGLSVKAGACVECGECESRCPYHLPIRQMLKKVAADFGA
ncbi:MAG: 4Fe-4S dicluster domain-containing protein, partial [Oscillospiraceae bacterium]|nr:4Fe-4S dicluster domain-containing protein [Oscillospiraceae bacterium]